MAMDVVALSVEEAGAGDATDDCFRCVVVRLCVRVYGRACVCIGVHQWPRGCDSLLLYKCTCAR